MMHRICLIAVFNVIVFGAAWNVLADEQQEKGEWESLFAGDASELEKWTPDARPLRRGKRGAWLVQDSELTMEKNAGYLWTKEKYDNFSCDKH